MPEPSEPGRSIPIDPVAALYRARLEREEALSLSLAAQVRQLAAENERLKAAQNLKDDEE